ncbi:hypothetical protein [Parapedobacter indicus]|uniref:Uncharacterized protein n=1 Tax=Parapedobacter indicus TaxID=1477437 RepID=A0A1I3UKL5_9SPHI|nr:hypothetical protein [Parapedobacter indicus]PPK99308.1 hypothetical protein CLV26_114160 [Parapedobacter indicus]SFJ82366.1 hypothetical protein SAMN05444682_114160 [Parapedobacter indicus]
MKEAEDTLIKATNIIAKAEAIRPVPATTPEMMEYYRQHLQLNHSNKDLLIGAGFAVLGPRLTADLNADRFTIRLSNPIYTKGDVAYLTLANGTVNWRYAHSEVRYARCPTVRDPVLMQWLDGLFAAFYLQAELPESLNGALEMLGPWDRVRWVRTNLFEGGRPEETLSEEIDMWVYDLHSTERLEIFFRWISEGLDKDEKHFRYTVCCEGDEDTVFYLLRYREREALAFPAGKEQPVLYLAAVLNSILQPDYELRRFRDKKLGKDGILMPMTPKDWETLSGIYGPMAIEARFSPIHGHVKTTKGRRPTMDP